MNKLKTIQEIKIIKIHNCGECHHCYHDAGLNRYACEKIFKKVVLKRIHNDCPLDSFWDAI